MKDARGHGSNGRGGNYKPLPNHPYHQKTNAELRYIIKDAGEAGRNAHEMGDERGSNKYADQVNDAHTVLGYRDRTGSGPDADNNKLMGGMQTKLSQDVAAGRMLASGPKSTPAPIHDNFRTATYAPGPSGHSEQPSVNGLGAIRDAHASSGGRYNAVAVNKAIESSNRSGRKIGGKEAKAIHALLKGRH